MIDLDDVAPVQNSGATPGNAITRRSIGSPGVLSLLAVLTIAACVWLAPGASDTGLRPAHRADSYTRLVNDYLVPVGWLVRVDDPVTGAPRVELSKDAPQRKELTDFLHNSYLGEDLASNDSDLWSFNGGAVRGIQVNAHTLLDPFALQDAWGGDLLFRETEVPDTVLLTPRGEIALRPDRKRDVDSTMVNIETGEIHGIGRSHVDFFRKTGTEATATVASLRMMGERAVLRIPCAASRARDVTVITAVHAPQRCRESADGRPQIDWIDYPLSNRDRIEFGNRAAKQPGIAFSIARKEQRLSRHRPFGPRLPGLAAQDLSEDIVGALNSLHARSEGQSDDQDVRLTLDLSMQLQVERALGSYGGELAKSLGRSDDRFFPGAVTVMDAASGDLLALGSYPRRTALERDWDAQNSYLSRNQNFVALPVGSAAKVPVSAAILARFPLLARLCIPATSKEEGRFHTILGARLPSPIGDTVTGGVVDFDRFLMRSSNRFAAALSMLAAGSPVIGPDRRTKRFVSRSWELGESDHYAFRDAEGKCGTPVERVPAYVFPRLAMQPKWARQPGSPSGSAYAMVDSLPGALSAFQGGPSWIEWMQHLFALRGLTDGSEPATYDGTIWDRLLESNFSGGSDPDDALRSETLSRYRHFAGISPDRMRFDLDSASDLRNGYLMTILGGGGSRWTAVKLAESYARVVMQKPVTASLAAGTPPPDGVYRKIGTQAHAALIHGMAQVVTPNGTASAIGTALAAVPTSSGELRAYAKTGTPTLKPPARSRRNRLLDTLIRSQLIGLDSHTGLVLRDRANGEPVATAIIRLAANRKIVLARGDAAWVANELTSINTAWRKGDDSPLIFDRSSKLLGVRENESEQLGAGEVPEGGVLAMVVGRYCPGAPANQPLRALSIVINIQARTLKAADQGGGSDPNPAVELAKRLLGGKGRIAAWLNQSVDGGAKCSI